MEFIYLLVVILFIIIATVKFKVHPIFSLILAAIISGLCIGLNPDEILSTIAEGFGKTLSSIGLVIAFGTIIGIFLEKTGSTSVLANGILSWIGMKRSPLAINLAGFIISIPVFCDSGFIILSSINKAISKKSGIPLLVYAIALSTGLYAAHVFVPPTPGPLAAAAILEADLGTVLILGIIVAIPVSLMGYVWARYIGKSLTEQITEASDSIKEEVKHEIDNITFTRALLPLVVPIFLIALKSIADYPTKPFGNEIWYQVFNFIGNPIIALLIGVLFAYALTIKTPSSTRTKWVSGAFKQAGEIVLITGAGGAFGAILRTFDIASLLNFESSSGLLGLVICFVISAILKSAQGSSTVAIITTAAIIAPLLSIFGLQAVTEKALCVLAIGAGAMTVSHVNDSYFWVVSQFSNMSVKNTLRGHTLATLFQGLTGILVILLLYQIL